MSGRDTDVERIDRRLLWQGTAPNQLTCKLRRLVGERKNRNPAKCLHPPGPRRRIPNRSLIENEL